MQQTQTQPKPAPLPPAESLGVRFCQWFSHLWHWIYAFREKPNVKPQWHTETRYPLEPRNLWKAYQDPHKYKLLGLRFGNETRYCLIDIDRGSPYHPANSFSGFKDVLAALEEIGLTRPLLVRSSESGGIHIYYFLPAALPTFALACVIRTALENAGLQLRSGELEAFPNVKSYSKDKPTNYNAHRLPLQFGSYLLDNDGEPFTDDVGQFLDAADAAAAGQDLPTLVKAIADSEGSHFKFICGKSSRAEEWKRHLEERIAEGWTGKGQTNELLKDFATYGVVWQALSGNALINFVVETAKAAPGYQQYCGHQSNIRQRAAEWAKSVEGWYSPYRSFPKRDGRSYRENFEQAQNNIVKLENQANVSSRQQAANRIQQALAHLRATDTLPYGATARAAAIIATVKELTGRGMSLATLHQPCHLSLWHPGQQKSLEPAQGELLHPVLELEPNEKSLEPAQGELLHPTSLYEGVVPDEGQPTPLQGVGALPLIQTLESQTSTPHDEASCCCSPGDLSANDCHTNCHTGAASAAPAALVESEVQPAALEAQPAAPGSSDRLPSIIAGQSPETIRRLTSVWLQAGPHAKKTVRIEQQIEGCEFSDDERSRRETIAKMQFFWRSGEPLLMDEVKLWLADHPGVRLDI